MDVASSKTIHSTTLLCLHQLLSVASVFVATASWITEGRPVSCLANKISGDLTPLGISQLTGNRDSCLGPCIEGGNHSPTEEGKGKQQAFITGTHPIKGLDSMLTATVMAWQLLVPAISKAQAASFWQQLPLTYGIKAVLCLGLVGAPIGRSLPGLLPRVPETLSLPLVSLCHGSSCCLLSTVAPFLHTAIEDMICRQLRCEKKPEDSLPAQHIKRTSRKFNLFFK